MRQASANRRQIVGGVRVEWRQRRRRLLQYLIVCIRIGAFFALLFVVVVDVVVVVIVVVRIAQLAIGELMFLSEC